MTIDEIELVARLSALMAWVPAYTAERLMRMANDHWNLDTYAKQLALETPLTLDQARAYLQSLREIIMVVEANNVRVDPIV